MPRSSTPLQTARRFLSLIASRNTALMRSMCVPGATIVNIRDGNSPRLSTIDEVLSRMDTVPVAIAMDEISHNEIEHIDGCFATVWTPYEFWQEGKLHHVGSNNFCLWHNPKEDKWLITAIQDVGRTVEGAEEEAAPFGLSRG